MELKKELESFKYAFQITKTVIFNVEYYRLGNNDSKYFTTSAIQFCRNKKDYNICGQCQDKTLPEGAAREFYIKWNKLHLKDLTNDQYQEIKKDIEILKHKYNYLEILNNDEKIISFSQMKNLSMNKLK